MSGEVPKGWRKLELGEFCTEHRRRAKSSDIPIFSVSKDYGLIAQSELFGRRIASADTSNYKTLRRGEYAYDPMLLWTGSIGCLWRASEAMISPAYTTFGIDPSEVFPSFFNTFMKMPRMIERYRSISHGTNVRRKKAHFDDFSALVATIPPLPEQRAIAEVLGAAEATIAKAEAMIAALAEAKHAAMRELLTRGIRREKTPMKPLPSRWVLGRVAPDVTHIPADWDLVTLTKVAKLESGHTPSRDKTEYWGGNIPWLSLADTDALDALKVHETSECVTAKGIKNSSARILPVDTVVFSRTATVGKSTRMGREMATSQDFANWVCGSMLHPAYLVQVFRHMGREWDRLEEGSTHQTIYMPVFKKLQILLPSMSEQQKIAEVGEAFDLRISNERTARDTLARNRDALAQELLSGRLRLPDSMIARHADNPGQAA
jgi:type I restriction enzyme, S subunit